MIPHFVYALCALTSVLCAVLMVRSFLRSRQRAHLWLGLCFAALAVNNVLLFLNVVVVRSIDLSVTRAAVALAAMAAFLFVLIWEAR